MPVTAKLPPAQQYERKKSILVLFAAFAYEVGTTEDGKNCNASAERSVSILVVTQTVIWQHGSVGIFTIAINAIIRRCTALEKTASIGVGERGEAKSEDNGDCYYSLFHRMWFYLINNFCVFTSFPLIRRSI